MSHVYLSYGPQRADDLLVVHELLRRAQIPTWYDAKVLEGGESLNESPDGELRRSFCGVLLIDRESLKSKRQRQELEELQRAGIPVIPVLLEDFKTTNAFYKEIAKLDLIRLEPDRDEALGELVERIRRLYQHRCPVVSVMNLKGGVGKTTVSAQVFGALQAERKNRVLLIDLDPQYNLTQYLLPFHYLDKQSAEDRSVISLFEPGKVHRADYPSPGDAWDTISERLFVPVNASDLTLGILDNSELTGRLDLITGQFEISKYAFSTDEAGLVRVAENFHASLDRFRRDYDLIVLDTNPVATVLTRLVFDASDHILVPIRADSFSLRGITLLSKLKQSQSSDPTRGKIHALFNGVRRSEPHPFERDVRDGRHDADGAKVSDLLLTSALPLSQHFATRVEQDPERPWRRLAVHHGVGGGLSQVRRDLAAVAVEVAEKLFEPTNR